jgi:hypothetical protein
LKRKDCKLDRSSLSLQRLLPQKAPLKNGCKEKTFIYHDVLAKETKYSIAKMELLLRN